jgi:hypothetical protein
MAAPNIVNVTTINGNTAVANVTNVASNLVVNSASSNKVVKINSLYISNIDGETDGSINIAFTRAEVNYFIAKTIIVPADSTLDIVSKSIYLQEGDTIKIDGSSNSLMQAVCSFEEIS